MAFGTTLPCLWASDASTYWRLFYSSSNLCSQTTLSQYPPRHLCPLNFQTLLTRHWFRKPHFLAVVIRKSSPSLQWLLPISSLPSYLQPILTFSVQACLFCFVWTSAIQCRLVITFQLPSISFTSLFAPFFTFSPHILHTPSFSLFILPANRPVSILKLK